MSEDMFGGGINPGLNSGLGPSGMNGDIARQMSLLGAAGRLRATSAGGQQQMPQQQQQRPMGMVPPVPPNIPDKQRAHFMLMLTQVLAGRGVALPPFVTGQPNPGWMPGDGPLKALQPASDNRPGALRLPNSVPGRSGDIDLFKLWTAVTSSGGMQRITQAGQWDNVAAHIGLQLPPPMPGSSHPPATQLAQLYFMLLAPLEDHMKRSAQAKMLAQQQQQQQQNQHAQQPLTPAQMHQQQQQPQQPNNPMQSGLGGMQNPALGGMQNPGMGMQNPAGLGVGGALNPALGGMQNPGMGGMQNPALGGMQNPALASLQGMQNQALGVGGMQNPGMGAMPNAGLGGMQNPALGGMPNSGGLAGMQNPALGGMQAPALDGLQNLAAVPNMGMHGVNMTPAQLHQQRQQQQQPGAGAGGAMPPPAPADGLGKRKSEPDEDEKRAKAKVGDPTPPTPTTTGPNRRTKIEYVPLRLDVETYGGRALDNMIASGGNLDRPVKEISDLGLVDIFSITFSLRARTPKALSYALGTLAVLSAHAQQTFPLARCEDLLDELVDVLESAAWEGEEWTGGILGTEPDTKPAVKEEEEEWESEEEVPIRTHRELVRLAAEMGLGMRVKGKAWDGSEVIGKGVKVEEEDVKMEGDESGGKVSYTDFAPPGIARSDVVLTIVRLLRNFSIGPENCAHMAREGSKVLDVLAGLIGFKEGKRKEIVGWHWEDGIEVSITPLTSALTLPQLLRVRKDILHTVANMAPHVRLSGPSTARNLFTLVASFILDPADTRSPVQLYQHLPHRRFSLTTDLALDALTKIAHSDGNRAVFQRAVPAPLLKATFGGLIKMLPFEANDMLLIARAEPWIAYCERVALSLYALACCCPGNVRRDIRTQRATGAAVLHAMCRMALHEDSSKPPGTQWVSRNPFACIVRRVIEALRIVDEPEDGAGGEVVGWPVRGVKVEGEKGAGWLAGVGSDDALLMMVIDGMDPVTFEDLEAITRVGEVGA
ncbi:ARID/BRIGHT DNA binding domain [Ceratobasidium sp. AG-Ba]|nr:ARID/BRIGHT DNA binding domain [Ceratobasidium sp. AG-Ba]QRW11312.1 ARID/BRIGHT DNA binding domain [Ceratobasidium sp. AG-Ba]